MASTVAVKPERTMTPFGMLFLPAPPDEKPPLPDFRRKNDKPIGRLSPNLLDTIHDMQRRQQWMRDRLIELGREELSFVGSMKQHRGAGEADSRGARPRSRLGGGMLELDYAGKTKEVEVLDAGDSGIYLRGSSKSQINIWCWPVGSGEVYGYRMDKKQPESVRAGVTPKVNADKPIGQWNRFIITMKGDRLTVDLNGKRVIDNAQLPGIAGRGRIALQHHGDPIQFANVYVRELKSQ